MYVLKVSKEFEKFYKKRTAKEREKIDEKLTLLTENPINNPSLDISAYLGEQDTYRLRYRDYRIIYRVKEDILLIFLLKAGSRGDVYK
jgi:mRNA interferase RelE/StbE